MSIMPKNALDAAIGNGRTRRFRDFAIVIFDGEGAICVPSEVWMHASLWSAGRASCGNRLQDRFQLLQRIEILVTRHGTSAISTAGAPLRLARLRDAMKREGLGVKEWNFPPDDILDKALNLDASKKAGPKDDTEPTPAQPSK